jgi:transcriptional regulator with XRE-family HTH domain
MIAEVIKSTRRKARLTQEQLARKTGTKKSYISRIENGKSDIQLSTLYKIVEKGLGKKINLTIG